MEVVGHDDVGQGVNVVGALFAGEGVNDGSAALEIAEDGVVVFCCCGYVIDPIGNSGATQAQLVGALVAAVGWGLHG